MTVQPFFSETSVPKQVLWRKEEEEEGKFPSVDKLSTSSVAADSFVCGVSPGGQLVLQIGGSHSCQWPHVEIKLVPL